MIIVGDGVNNTPALAAVDIGVAVGARGTVVSSETADIVLLVDRLDQFVNATRIVRHTRSVALQSVIIGASLSPTAMIVAALGHLPSLVGIILQEFIDVLAIAGVLRALLPTPDEATRSLVYASVERPKAEHAELEPILSRVRLAAGALPHMRGSAAKDALLSFNQSLAGVLVSHERRGDTQLYPDVTRLLGEGDPMAAMNAIHRKIFHVTSLLGRTVAGASVDGPGATVTQELQRLLYRFDAILRLHCTQEDELLHVLGGGVWSAW